MSRRLQGESWFSAGDRVKPLGVRVSGGADRARHGEDRPGGGGRSPAVLLGRAVVQSVVGGVRRRGPACLADVQRAHGLIAEPHRAGRGRERSGRKARGRGRASGTSHLSHAAQAPPPPETHTQAEMRNKDEKKRTINKEGAEKKEKEGMKQRKTLLGPVWMAG